MCGIAGFYQTQQKLNAEDLICMTDAQPHRGPDAAGYEMVGLAGLGHRRLSIIDLSDAANQPFFSADKRYVAVYNGEVYNFKEIQQELKTPMRTNSDTEVILNAYIELGSDCVNRFNGMFAFAIYDTFKEELFIGRDRLGIKPLYYYHHDGVFAFSSELKGLLALRPKLKFSLDKQAIQDYLLLGYIPEPLSLCKEIRKFPAGYVGVLNKNGLETTQFWNMYEKFQSETVTDEKSAHKTLSGLIDSAVQYRMIADVPFGTFLSGGIDSSVVTAFAQKNASAPINTFSIGFKDGKYNEAIFAKAVANHLGTNHHEFMVTEADAIELLDKLVDAMDEPFADGSVIPTMLVSKLARKHVTMTLSGDGGDELFLGYGSYNWAERMSKPWVQAVRKPIYNLLSMSGDSRRERAAHHFNYPHYDSIRTHIFSQEQYYFSEQEIAKLFHGEVLKPSVTGKHPHLPRKLRASEEQALFDLGNYLKDDLLAKVDRSTMQFSLETRVPLLDYRIVEFALNLDPSLKIKNGQSKYLLRQVLFDLVPKELFDRPKWGFGIPLDKWLKSELSYLIEKYLSREQCEKYDLINYDILKKYIEDFRKGKDYYYNRLWQIIVLHKSLENTGIS